MPSPAPVPNNMLDLGIELLVLVEQAEVQREVRLFYKS
jgi:hypothetical protein